MKKFATVGDTVKIINVKEMWNKDIFNTDDKSWLRYVKFKNGDICTLRLESEYLEQYKLEIIVEDCLNADGGHIFYSLSFSMYELSQFIEVV